MKKRILSAIMALAVSVSAFAGLAISASAAENTDALSGSYDESTGVFTWTMTDSTPSEATTYTTTADDEYCNLTAVLKDSADNITAASGIYLKEVTLADQSNTLRNHYLMFTAVKNGTVNATATLSQTGGTAGAYTGYIYVQQTDDYTALSKSSSTKLGQGKPNSSKGTTVPVACSFDVVAGQSYILYSNTYYKNSGRISATYSNINFVPSEAAMYSVTVNYVDQDGNTVAPSVSATVEAGTEYTPTYTEEISTESAIYTYASGADAITVNENAEINVVYTRTDLTTVTIERWYNDTKIADDVTVISQMPGESYTVADDYKADVENRGDVKTVYSFDESNVNNVLTIDSLSTTATENVIKLYFTATEYAAVESVSISYVYGDTVLYTTTVTDDCYEADEYTYYYPAYYEKDGVYYKAETTDSNVYGKTVTLTEGNLAETVAYSPVTEDVVFYQEAEDAASSGKHDSWHTTGIDVSNGTSMTVGRTGGYVEFSVTVDEDAYYNFAMKSHTGTNRDVNVFVDDNNTMVEQYTPSSNHYTYNYKTLLTAGTHTIRFVANYSTLPSMDYLVVTKTEANAATFAEEVQFDPNADKASETNPGTLRFKAALVEKNFTAQTYGFKFVNFADDSDSIANYPSYGGDVTGTVTKDFTGDLEANDVFYHDITGIPVEATGVGFYAVPYVYGVDGQFYYGTPFTYEADFDWTGLIFTETK